MNLYAKRSLRDICLIFMIRFIRKICVPLLVVR
jgi:hypothetical protein